MMRRCLLALTLCLAACSEEAAPWTDEEIAVIAAMGELPPLPAAPTNRFADDPRAAHLGRFLFFDTRLSRDGRFSCATCHDPSRSFSDELAVAEGLQRGRRNTPALWNIGHARWLSWDGRQDSLWMQALGPIENDLEMGHDRTAIARLIRDDAELKAAVEAVFGPLPALPSDLPPHARPIPEQPEHPEAQAWAALDAETRHAIDRVYASVGKSLHAFQRTIATKPAPFDRFAADLRAGRSTDETTFSAAARRGLKLFLGTGQCTLCHTGPLFTDLEFHNIGLAVNPELGLDTGRFDGIASLRASAFHGMGPHSDAPEPEANPGLHFVDQKPSNLGEFKTPSLRHVADTAPYMHDGRFATLEDVLRFYSKLDQEPAIGHREESLRRLDLSEGEIADLAAFLRSLSGPPAPRDLREPPASPKL